MNIMKKEKIVEAGYDEIAEEYHATRDIFKHEKEIKKFIILLPKKAKVLDVGCGAGVPVAKTLVNNNFDVVGIDLSESMIKLARKNVPKAKFMKKDMTKLDFKENSFDGLTAFYSIIHVPREKHTSIFQSFHKILKTNGVILVSVGSEEWEGTSEDFHGAKMFWSHYSPERSLQIIKDAGFEIIFDKYIVSGGEKHYWILAKNKK
jgi:ubiquinone/menaquinone biosynthesis C-methylase UbiE